MVNLMSGRDDDSLLGRFAGASISLFEEFVKDPLDEIRGHFTASQLRDWISSNKRDLQAASCAIHLDLQKKAVVAFLLADDGSFLYLSSGKKAATAFSARSMDDEMKRIFEYGSTVVLQLQSKDF
jgi:hypothetical protein